jgi:hypothetical protein
MCASCWLWLPVRRALLECLTGSVLLLVMLQDCAAAMELSASNGLHI